MELVRHRHWHLHCLDLVLRRRAVLEAQALVHVHSILLGRCQKEIRAKGKKNSTLAFQA